MEAFRNTAKSVERGRKEKDEFFRTSPSSPIPHGDRDHFRGLHYYRYDPAYRVQAALSRFPGRETIVMETSKGSRTEYLRYGILSFQLNGQTVKLVAYKSVHGHGHESLFVPFRDATSGKETYGAGRYLDLELSRGDSYVVDFNLAYNPYCAYSDDYVCPFPPVENWLEVPVLAGEKTYK